MDPDKRGIFDYIATVLQFSTPVRDHVGALSASGMQFHGPVQWSRLQNVQGRRIVAAGGLMRIWVALGATVGILFTLILPAPSLAGGWCGYGYPDYSGLFGATSFYMGYFNAPNRVTLSFDRQSPSATDLNGFSHQVDLQGLWLELLVPVRGCGPLGMMIGAAYHFPFARSSLETRNGGGIVPGVLELTWDVAPQWWGFQLGLTYDVVPGLTALAGFKYDNFQVNFFNVRPTLPAFDVFGGVGDRADVTISQYLPCFGFAFKRDVSRVGCEIELAAIGFPMVPGSVDFSETVHSGLTIGGFGPHNTVTVIVPNPNPPPNILTRTLFPIGFPASNNFRRGTFLECFAEASWLVRSFWRVGAFGRYNLTRASTVVDPGERSRAPTGAVSGDLQSFGIPRVNYDFTFDRRVWTVGGVFSFAF